MIRRIEPLGQLISQCTLPGETKAEGVWPAHANALQLSAKRWLVVYATRGYRFMDDDRSVIYQIRENAPNGKVIREGWLSKVTAEWDPIGDGKKYYKQHGHPVVFGVPKGAMIGGKRVAHENLFVAKWRVLGIFDFGPVDDSQLPPEDLKRWTGINLVSHKINLRYGWGRSVGQNVEWIQFRLNDREDDIEILEPIRNLRQVGYESGDAFCCACRRDDVKNINQSFVPAIPFNEDRTEWVDVNHFDSGRIAPLKYRYDPACHRYQWVEVGPMIGNPERGMFEASIARVGDHFIIAGRPKVNGRRGGGAGWMRSSNPFKSVPEPFYTPQPNADTPIAIFTGADGVLRMFANDVTVRLPQRGGRNPLYCWDINPESFTFSNQRVVFDTFDANLPMRPEVDPGIDMCKVLPHAGGNAQLIIHRVRTRALNIPYLEATVNDAEQASVGVYHERLIFDREYPPFWKFA